MDQQIALKAVESGIVADLNLNRYNSHSKSKGKICSVPLRSQQHIIQHILNTNGLIKQEN
jgi:hypothetical protein